MEKKGSYILGYFFLLLGLLGVFGSLVITYLDSIGYWNNSKDFFSSLFWNRGSEPIGLGIEGLQLFHYFVGGIVFSALGGGLLALKRRVISLVEEVTLTLKCSSCRNKWEEPISKKSLESMDYPKVKSLARRKCPICAKFTRPRIINVKS